MPTRSTTKFAVKIDHVTERSWIVGISLNHWYDETYLFVHLLRWSVSIGFLYKDIEGEELDD